MTNKARRLKNKLKIFEMECSGQLMDELINLTRNSTRNVSSETLINVLRSLYNKELEHEFEKGDKLEQLKMDL